ncbi:Fungal specific transcription factor [Apiospora rasikravindrae]|uniref:Fungal specific transcription factor n=1 Tax=Apiospora rasikravindrae TaxID=990691 RepID=A0ABR1SJV2_9PEZI
MTENEGRQRMTCEGCRHRKVKCNRAFPTCGRCFHLGSTCVYRDRVSRRATQSAVIHLLRERVRQAEARLVLQGNANAGDDALQPCQHGRGHSSSSSSLALTPPNTSMPSPLDQAASSLAPSLSMYDDANDGNDDEDTNDNKKSFGLPQFDDDTLAQMASTLAPSYSLCSNGHDDNSNVELPQFDEDALAQVDFNLDPFSSAEMREVSNLQPQDMDMGGDFPSFSDWMQTKTPPFSVDETTTSAMIQLIVPPDYLNTLHQTFFAKFAPVMPIIAKNRFNEELLSHPNDIALKAVSCAIALLGASISETHRYLEKACYSQARYFVDLCETGDETSSFKTIRFLQALLLLIRYELNKGYCARAWLTFSRATGVTKIMRLSQMDQMRTPTETNEPQLPYLGLPSTTDMVELEERRRCLWALYMLQGFCCVTTGRAGPLEDAELFTFLPSAGDLDVAFEPSHMPYVTEVTAIGNDMGHQISSFCGIVIVLSLVRRVLQHVSDASDPTAQPTGFWDRHYKLVSLMDMYERMLRPPFSMRAVYADTLAFNAHLTFCGAEIRLYEAAIDQGEQQGLSRLVSAESAKHSIASALKVASTIRSTWSSQRPLCNNLSMSSAFVSWPLTMAIQAFSRQAYSEQQEVHGNMIRMLHGTLEEADGPGGPWQKLVNGLPTPRATERA